MTLESGCRKSVCYWWMTWTELASSLGTKTTRAKIGLCLNEGARCGSNQNGLLLYKYKQLNIRTDSGEGEDKCEVLT